MKTTILFLVMAANCFGQNSITDIFNKVNNYYFLKLQEKDIVFIPPSVEYYSKNNPAKTLFGKPITEMNFMYNALLNQVLVSTDFVSYLKSRGYSNQIFEMIVAHEYGHYLQFKLKAKPLTSIESEALADCIAGVYFNNNNIQLNSTESYRFFTEFDANDKGIKLLLGRYSHGDEQLRIQALMHGYESGSINTCINLYDITSSLIKPSN